MIKSPLMEQADFRMQRQAFQTQETLYFGLRVQSVTTDIGPAEKYSPNPDHATKAYYRTIVGFQLALAPGWFVFFGMGFGLPNDVLKNWWVRSTDSTFDGLQDSMIMLTEYGIGWDF